MFSPDRAAFRKAAASGANLIPLAQSWPADLETPLTTWIKVGAGHPPGVLLESVEGGETLGRWSVIACDPLGQLRLVGINCSAVGVMGVTTGLRAIPLKACVNALLLTSASAFLVCRPWDSFTACGGTN